MHDIFEPFSEDSKVEYIMNRVMVPWGTMVKVCLSCELEVENGTEKCPVCGGELRKRTVGDAIVNLFEASEKKDEST
jgi:RNA polymerase subunit RPABC4/transcription elongation factor Spt4